MAHLLMALPRAMQTRADYQAFLDADLAAHALGQWNLLESIRHPEVRFQRRLRRVEYLLTRKSLAGRALLAVAKLRLLRAMESTGVQIPAGVAGPGLSVAHFGSIVVNSRARIGTFCRIHSSTNIGTAGGGVPRIGDFVYIGPGAVVYGDITVGDRVVIGANAVVNRDVPAGVTVAGAPARVIAERDSSSIMPSWFPVSSSLVEVE